MDVASKLSRVNVSVVVPVLIAVMSISVEVYGVTVVTTEEGGI